MYAAPTLALKYLRYYLGASNGKGHGLHSPFVFDFVTNVLNDRQTYPAYATVESLRSRLLKDQRVLPVLDLGAGSGLNQSNERKIAAIASHAAKPKKLGQLLYRMVQYYQPQTLIELGTSLGITTAYLAKAAPAAQLMTIEGSPAIAETAAVNLKELAIENVKLITGNFDDQLPVVLESLSGVDFAFVDGNHREQPTIQYFEALLKKVQNNSILVFDDIHWSREMESAWETIRKHPAVRCTIDLFFIGIVVFRQEFREKQHFVIRH
ncbi:MAG: class I SAM-dependent methyltransferase [Chitinophagaceae bacterium]|nr:class I SAM-dependent methyltransferase [Chitinophagaceae bacterium]